MFKTIKTLKKVHMIFYYQIIRSKKILRGERVLHCLDSQEKSISYFKL